MSDIPVRLKPRAIVPAGWPPDVLPNQVITAAHINAIRSSVYAWPGDVDGQGHTLSNVHLAGATGVLADPTTTAGDLIARGALAIGRFPIGADGQILAVDLAAPAKLKWATPAAAPVLSVFGRFNAVVAQAGDYTAAMVTGALADPTTTKGDLIARGAAAPGRLPAGIDGQVLRADAAAAAGLRWAGESVPSVFGRTSAIAAQAGDYTAADVTNAVSVIERYPDPAWVTSLSYAKLIGTPATFAPAPHTHDASAIVSGVVATARLGSGVADATVYLRGDGTWAAAGSGGGGGVVSVFGRAGAVIAQAGDYTAAMVTGAVVDPTTSTGDLIVRNNVNALTRLPIGANGQVLQTDTATSVGMKWTTISASVQTPWVTNINAANFDLVNVHRLGVALAVPNYAIDVVGDVNYTGVLRVNGVPVTFGGSQTPWTQAIDASGFALNNVGTLGIGTAAPQSAPLVVASHTPGIAGSVAVQDKDANVAGNPVLLISGMSSEGTRCWALGNRGGATYGKDLYVWNDRASDMLFGTNSAERMRITAGGLVGIGTAAPGNLLTLAGGVAAPSLRFAGANPAYNWDIGRENATTGDFVFLQNGTGGTPEKMRIAVATGNVGIGTASPNETLQVQGAFRVGNTTFTPAGFTFTQDASGHLQIQYKTAPSTVLTNIMTMQYTGNVGIGTAAPAATLHVHAPTIGAANTLAVLSCPFASAGDYQQIKFQFDPAQPIIASAIRSIRAVTGSYGTHLAFAVEDTASPFALNERMRISAAGNVGINCDTPYSRLSVNSAVSPTTIATTNQIAIGEGGNNPQYRLNLGFGAINSGNWAGCIQSNVGGGTGVLLINPSGGSVGIAHTAPVYALDVAGDINYTGTLRRNGAPVGGISVRSDYSGSGRALNGVYQNGTSQPLFVTVTASINQSQYMQLLSGAANPPTNILSASTNPNTSLTSTLTCFGWVMPGQYYKANTPGATLVSWFEWA